MSRRNGPIVWQTFPNVLWNSTVCSRDETTSFTWFPSQNCGKGWNWVLFICKRESTYDFEWILLHVHRWTSSHCLLSLRSDDQVFALHSLHRQQTHCAASSSAFHPSFKISLMALTVAAVRTPVGLLIVTDCPAGLCSVSFAGEKDGWKDTGVRSANLDSAIRWITDYFSGKRFDSLPDLLLCYRSCSECLWPSPYSHSFITWTSQPTIRKECMRSCEKCQWVILSRMGNWVVERVDIVTQPAQSVQVLHFIFDSEKTNCFIW